MVRGLDPPNYKFSNDHFGKIVPRDFMFSYVLDIWCTQLYARLIDDIYRGENNG